MSRVSFKRTTTTLCAVLGFSLPFSFLTTAAKGQGEIHYPGQKPMFCAVAMRITETGTRNGATVAIRGSLVKELAGNVFCSNSEIEAKNSARSALMDARDFSHSRLCSIQPKDQCFEAFSVKESEGLKTGAGSVLIGQ